MKQLTAILLLLSFAAGAQNRFIKNGGSDSNNGLTDATAWATMEKARTQGQAGNIHAGDTIFFKRGGTYLCADRFNGMTWWGSPTGSSPSGTAGNPIVFDAYGTGDAPNMLFPHPASTDSTSRRVMSFEGVRYIVVRNLQFNENRTPLSKRLAAWTGCGVVFGERGSGQETRDCKVENCYFSKVGLGVVIVGDRDTVYNCVMDSLGNVDAIGSDSYGCNGITISGTHHYIARNTISGGWCYSSAFGLNGGAIEAFNTVDTCTVEYNNFWDNGAVVEWGATAANSFCRGNKFQFNKFSNNGNISYINVTGAFTITPANLQFLNNVIIENRQSRYSGPNYGDGMDTFPTWPTLPSAETRFFQNNGSPTANPVWNLQNNIFYSTNNLKVFQSNGIVNHKSNLAFFKSGAGWGYTADPSELITTSKIFFDTTNINTALWDVHMPVNFIPAQSLGGTDWDGKTSPVRTGVYYDLSTPPEPNVVPFPAWINGKLFTGWKVL